MRWLEEATGKTDREWIEIVQHLIAQNTVPTIDPNHGDTDVSAWILTLTEMVMEMSASSEPVDGNMYAARTVSAILALWYHNIQFAKTRDPRRPIKLRLASQDRLGKWRVGMVKIVMERNDYLEDIFSGQEFEDPKSRTARDGTFI